LRAFRGVDRTSCYDARGRARRPGCIAGFDVVGAILPQHTLRVVVASVRADRDERTAALDFGLVVLRFFLRYAHACQRTGDGSDACTDCGATQRCRESSSGDEWTDARDGERTDADEPSAQAAQESTSYCARRRTRTRVRARILGHFLRLAFVGRQNADRVWRKAIVLERFDGLARLFALTEQPDNRGTGLR
jgi:hypothetical protein